MGELLTCNTSRLRAEVAAHVAADQVVQGTYWHTQNQHGCFIGCLSHDHKGSPEIVEARYGIPVMLQRIAESIFERLPAEEAVAFFAAFPDAVGCDGKGLSCVGWQFLLAELRSLPPQSEEIQGVIDPVIAGLDQLARGLTWDQAAADAAAGAARAARAAADAEWAAAGAADAARAAAGAEWAARAAGDAVTRRQRDLLLRLIAEAEVRRG